MSGGGGGGDLLDGRLAGALLKDPVSFLESRCGRGSTRPLQKQGSSIKPP